MLVVSTNGLSLSRSNSMERSSAFAYLLQKRRRLGGSEEPLEHHLRRFRFKENARDDSFTVEYVLDE